MRVWRIGRENCDLLEGGFVCEVYVDFICEFEFVFWSVVIIG